MRPDPDRPRALQRLVLFLRRRRREALFAAGAFLALQFTAHAFPRRWEAEARVGPEGLGPYEAPVERLLASTLSPGALEHAAAVAGVSTRASLVELFGGARSLEQRLGARAVVRRTPSGALEGVSIHAIAPARHQAERLVELLAQALVDDDARQQRHEVDPAPGAVRGETAAALSRAQERLAALRAQHPALGDPGREAELRAQARAVVQERIELGTWEARAEAASGAVERLGEAVRREAELAWQAERQEQQARPAPPSEPAPVPAASPREPSRLERLEAELVRLLATRTDRHPDVRRLQREIEAEREASRTQGESPSSAPAPARSEPVVGPWRLQPVTHSGRTLLVAGDAPLEGGAPEATPPLAFVQRAPSYGAWIAARSDEALAQREVEARRRALEARQGEHARLQAEEAGLARARGDEAALLREVERLQRAAPSGPALAVAGPRSVPLQLVGPPRLTPLTWAPWSPAEGLVLALALALFTGWVVDMFDRSYYQVEELADLPVPVLGVIPRLRGR